MNITDIGTFHLEQGRQGDLNTNLARVSREKDEKLKEACSQFESIFMKQMLDSMRKTVTKSGLMDGGFSEEIFEDLLYDEYAQKMTQTASFGIADMLYRQFSEI